MPAVLAVIAGLGLLSAAVINMLPSGSMPLADIRIEPPAGTYIIGETFTIEIVVDSTIPVNVFAGELQFDPQVLRVQSIGYNTSIAQLWAERPWFSNGEGTLNFAGGTTAEDGFIGSGSLIQITFEAIGLGGDALALREARILKHDGLGTDVELGRPIDAIFTVEEMVERETIVAKSSLGTKVSILEQPPTTDLNNDGKQTVADISIFMTHLVRQNKRSDFNQDGKINTADLSIIMQAE